MLFEYGKTNNGGQGRRDSGSKLLKGSRGDGQISYDWVVIRWWRWTMAVKLACTNRHSKNAGRLSRLTLWSLSVLQFFIFEWRKYGRVRTKKRTSGRGGEERLRYLLPSSVRWEYTTYGPEYGRNRIRLMKRHHSLSQIRTTFRVVDLLRWTDCPAWNRHERHSQIRPELLTCQPRDSDGCTKKYLISRLSSPNTPSSLLCLSWRL